MTIITLTLPLRERRLKARDKVRVYRGKCTDRKVIRMPWQGAKGM